MFGIFSKKQPPSHQVMKSPDNAVLPKGWYVDCAGQNPLFMLWYVIAVNFDDLSSGVEKPRHVVVEDMDTYQDALSECVKQITEKYNG